MTVNDVYNFINNFAPFSSQAEWDNAGLLLGDKNAEVKKTLVCLDVTLHEVKQAVETGANLIISHHPVIFNPQKSFLSGTVSFILAQNNISVISAHTNLDKAAGGVNDTLCRALNMNFVKLPESVADGYLNVGTISGINNCKELCLHINNALKTNVKYFNFTEKIDKIAVCSGAGADYVREAAENGCTAFITGDASYHDFLEAAEIGVNLFAAGHFETEIVIVNELIRLLSAVFGDVLFIASNRKNPIISEN